MSFLVSAGLEFPAVPLQAVPVIEGRPAAVRAYAAEMARQHLNAADVATKAEVDPGTVQGVLVCPAPGSTRTWGAGTR